MIFTGFVGYAACANTPVATQTVRTNPANRQSNVLKAMIPFLLLDTAIAPGTGTIILSPAAVLIIATKARPRPSPARGPMDAAFAAVRDRLCTPGKPNRARG